MEHGGQLIAKDFNPPGTSARSVRVDTQNSPMIRLETPALRLRDAVLRVRASPWFCKDPSVVLDLSDFGARIDNTDLFYATLRHPMYAPQALREVAARERVDFVRNLEYYLAFREAWLVCDMLGAACDAATTRVALEQCFNRAFGARPARLPKHPVSDDMKDYFRGVLVKSADRLAFAAGVGQLPWECLSLAFALTDSNDELRALGHYFAGSFASDPGRCAVALACLFDRKKYTTVARKDALLTPLITLLVLGDDATFFVDHVEPCLLPLTLWTYSQMVASAPLTMHRLGLSLFRRLDLVRPEDGQYPKASPYSVVEPNYHMDYRFLNERTASKIKYIVDVCIAANDAAAHDAIANMLHYLTKALAWHVRPSETVMQVIFTLKMGFPKLFDKYDDLCRHWFYLFGGLTQQVHFPDVDKATPLGALPVGTKPPPGSYSPHWRSTIALQAVDVRNFLLIRADPSEFDSDQMTVAMTPAELTDLLASEAWRQYATNDYQTRAMFIARLFQRLVLVKNSAATTALLTTAFAHVRDDIGATALLLPLQFRYDTRSSLRPFLSAFETSPYRTVMWESVKAMMAATAIDEAQLTTFVQRSKEIAATLPDADILKLLRYMTRLVSVPYVTLINAMMTSDLVAFVQSYLPFPLARDVLARSKNGRAVEHQVRLLESAALRIRSESSVRIHLRAAEAVELLCADIVLAQRLVVPRDEAAARGDTFFDVSDRQSILAFLEDQQQKKKKLHQV